MGQELSWQRELGRGSSLLCPPPQPSLPCCRCRDEKTLQHSHGWRCRLSLLEMLLAAACSAPRPFPSLPHPG